MMIGRIVVAACVALSIQCSGKDVGSGAVAGAGAGDAQTGEFPVGAAAVKELYDARGTTVVGHSVYLHVAAGGGGSWYWFEHLARGVGADGLGTSGTPRDTCVACHASAGHDGASGHDFVFTQVR